MIALVEEQWVSTNGQASVVLRAAPHLLAPAPVDPRMADYPEGAVIAMLTVSASTEGIDQVLWTFNPSKFAAVS